MHHGSNFHLRLPFPPIIQTDNVLTALMLNYLVSINNNSTSRIFTKCSQELETVFFHTWNMSSITMKKNQKAVTKPVKYDDKHTRP